MHKVLLVDDEPIILSGIKFLIDWESCGCEIAGTAHNGQQALERIGQLLPDIVICDIRMPVLSGLEVLRQATAKHPETVFIMLTNYQDFNLARDALRLQAVDYLLKTQLEPEALEKSLLLAMQESDRRRKISRIDFVEDYISTNESALISETVMKILDSDEDFDRSDSRIARLGNSNILQSYSLLKFIFDLSCVPNIGNFTEADIKRVLSVEQDMIKNLVNSLFANRVYVMPKHQPRTLLVFLWGLSENGFFASVDKLYGKVSSVSGNVTQVRLSLLSTGVFNGENQIASCREQINRLSDCFYNSKSALLKGDPHTETKFEALDLSAQISRLSAGLYGKNTAQIKSAFEKIRQAVSGTVHRRENGISLCLAVFSVVSAGPLAPAPDQDTGTRAGFKTEAAREIRKLLTKADVIAWLEKTERFVVEQSQDQDASRPETLVKACSYISENIDKHIQLSEVARQINLSPSYLSSLFKKELHHTFIDYINLMKIRRARELIKEGKYRIYEISYMLGFENAYYFSRIFKRYTNLTPTEYQTKCRNGEDCTPYEEL